MKNIVLIIVTLSLLGCGETYYSVRRSVTTDVPISNDCIEDASRTIADLESFKSVDGKSVPPQRISDRIVTRYIFYRRNGYVILDLLDDKDTSFLIFFGHMDYGFSPNHRRISRQKRFLEEVMNSIIDNCGIPKEKIKVTQECQNIKCNL